MLLVYLKEEAHMFRRKTGDQNVDNLVVDGQGKQKIKQGPWHRLVNYRYTKHLLVALVFMVLGGGALFVSAAKTTETLWSNSTIPKTLADTDNQSVELGVKFSSKYTGQVTGVKFYKSAQNTGTHTGTLWDNKGNKLATVTFTKETANGWQTAYFPQPVTIAANVTYVISYHAPKGHYSTNNYYFSNNSRLNGSLTAPASTSSSPNGVYKYGTTTAFPTETYQASNYWVDVVFTKALVNPPVSAAPPASVVATQSGDSIVVTWTSGTSSSTITGYKIYRNGSLLTTVGNVLTYTDKALTAGTTYSYKLVTVDGNGSSPQSVLATVTYNVSPPTPPTTPDPSTTPTPPTTTPTSPTTVTHGNQITTDNTGFAAWVGPQGQTCNTTDKLKVYTNTVSASSLGSSVSCVWLKGGISIDAPITITASKIDDVVNTQGHPVTLNYCTIQPNSPGDWSLGPSNFTATRSQILGSSDGVRYGGNTKDTLIENYIRVKAQSSADHNDGIQMYGASNGGTILRNNIDDRPVGGGGGPNGAIFIADGATGTYEIRDNYLLGGGYSLRLHESGYYRVTGNIIEKGTYMYGPVNTTNAIQGAFLEWSNNKLSDGTVLNP